MWHAGVALGGERRHRGTVLPSPLRMGEEVDEDRRASLLLRNSGGGEVWMGLERRARSDSLCVAASCAGSVWFG